MGDIPSSASGDEKAVRFTIGDLRKARASGRKIACLTAYDYSSARVLSAAGVPMLLVGDTAAVVVLGHDTTLPAPLEFMMQITAAVRRGAPGSMVIADMPFGSYQASTAQGAKNVMRMVQQSGCDVVKLETGRSHLALISRLSDAGVAVMAHIGLRPQAVGLSGGYVTAGRTQAGAQEIIDMAVAAERHGASALLLEATPAEVAQAVVAEVGLPVIGCGAGPACHGHVVVTHDAVGFATGRVPRFVEPLGDVAGELGAAGRKWVELIASGEYPASRHLYAASVKAQG